jgi:hypothetical protein
MSALEPNMQENPESDCQTQGTHYSPQRHTVSNHTDSVERLELPIVTPMPEQRSASTF